MLDKKMRISMVLAVTFGLCGCNYVRSQFGGNFSAFNGTDSQSTPASYESNVPLLKQPTSIVVCRSHQCAPAKLSMSTEYIYNSLLQLFDNNNYQKMLVCQADAQTHTCLENYVTLPIKVGVVPTNAYVDHIKITDVTVGKQNNTLSLILNYNLTYGGQVAECTPAKSLLFAKKLDHVVLEDVGYNCKMTTIGTTNVKTVFAIDYIDLDYGYIGGYYSIGFSGPAYGGGNGYMLLRFPKNAYPLSPALKAPKQSQRSSVYSGGNPSAASTNSATYADGVEIFPISKKQ